MIRDLPAADRPMEKLMAYGARTLTDSELIANIIRSGTKNQSSLGIAQHLLAEAGDLSKLCRMTVRELVKHEGIGAIKACQIVSALELGRRLGRPRDVVSAKISNPADLVDFFKHELAEEEVEKFVIVNLASNSCVIDWDAVTVGILNASLVHPREIYKRAMRSCASSIIAVHNHPSGSVTPSQEDFLITRRLYEAGKLVGISLVDHIIVGGDAYYSFRENRQLGI